MISFIEQVQDRDMETRRITMQLLEYSERLNKAKKKKKAVKKEL